MSTNEPKNPPLASTSSLVFPVNKLVKKLVAAFPPGRPDIFFSNSDTFKEKF